MAAAAQKPTSDIKWATPELAAQWRRVAKMIEANQAKEQELQEKAARYGARLGLDPQSIIMIRLAAMMDLLWPRDTAEGQHMRLSHDELVQEQIKASLEIMSRELGQQLLAMGAMLPPEQMAALQAPAGLLGGGAERRSRNHKQSGT